ncbi:hypothetical protein CVT25_000149, partial [Psilocybe cyanescens]
MWGAAWAATPVYYGTGRRWRHGRQPQGAIGDLGGLNGGGAGVNGAQQQPQSQGQQLSLRHPPTPQRKLKPGPSNFPTRSSPRTSEHGRDWAPPPGQDGVDVRCDFEQAAGRGTEEPGDGGRVGRVDGCDGRGGGCSLWGGFGFGFPANLPSFPAYLPP